MKKKQQQTTKLENYFPYLIVFFFLSFLLKNEILHNILKKTPNVRCVHLRVVVLQ